MALAHVHAGVHQAVGVLRGFRAGAKAQGVDAIEIAGDFTEQSGYEAAKAILKMKPRPTAVFCANDSMAIGALSGFRDAGVRVPDDMALVGFDDIPIARFLDPPLHEFLPHAKEQQMDLSRKLNIPVEKIGDSGGILSEV